jgi:CHAT domain-containing protein
LNKFDEAENFMSIYNLIFRELPSSEDEILGVKEIFGKKKSRVFLGKHFNRENFERYAPQSRIIHIATHFVNNVAFPNHSALLFSAVGGDTPFYYSHEILNVRLNSELVVLSACESSEKRLLGLRGLRGMSAAFKQAGVKSIIVSLWPVDEFSSRLVHLFYREYRDSKNASMALRKAKLQLFKISKTLSNKVKISFSHPFLWSNYILYNFSS